jgi:hypothetical protein
VGKVLVTRRMDRQSEEDGEGILAAPKPDREARASKAKSAGTRAKR